VPSAKSAPLAQSPSLGQWKLEDAKARLSEVVHLASSERPQLVTARGKEAAVVLNPETYRQLLRQDQKQTSLIEFLQRLDLP
jgi:prevent-host-death family protein